MGQCEVDAKKRSDPFGDEAARLERFSIKISTSKYDFTELSEPLTCTIKEVKKMRRWLGA